MNLNWFESVLYGLFSGLTDIVPVSSQVHKTLMLKIFGIKGHMEVMDLLVHLAIAAALYSSCRSDLNRMTRAKALSRIPKKKRKRPLDVRSMMDYSMLKTMLIPALIGLFFYQKSITIRNNLILMAVILLVNGIALYIPQFFTSGNKDSRTLSRVEGLLMGLGGAVSVIPGFSAMGITTAIGSVCGVDRKYCLNLTLMMNLLLNIGFTVYGVMGVLDKGFGTLSVMILLRYLMTTVIAYCSTTLGIRVMRHFADGDGYAVFAFYCFGLAMFTFVLNLMA